MFTFTVRPDGADSYEVSAGTRDVLQWEKTSHGKSMDSLLNNLAMVDLYKIAHLAARRQGLFTGTLQEFEQSCELEFELEREPDPTPPAP